jgi:hypothetical protein
VHLNTINLSYITIKTNSKILSILYLENYDIVLLALLSGYIYAFSSRNRLLLIEFPATRKYKPLKNVVVVYRDLLWKTKLNDAVLHMISIEDNEKTKVYCGLANGNLTLVEVSWIEINKL